MEGLILGTSSVGMSKCTLPHSGCCALILGIMILVPMATADTHSVEDWPALASVSPNQPPLAAPNHSPPPSPAALPASTIKASSQPGVPTPALATPRLPSPPPLSPAAADETHSNKPIPPADASSPSPSAGPKSRVVEQALEGSAPARRARDLHQPSVPVSQIVPTPTLLHSSQMWSPSPSSPSFGSAVTSDAHVNIHVMPPGLPPVENQAAPNTTTTTSTSTSSVLADAQDPEVVPASTTTAKLPVEISNAVVHDHQLSPSFTLNVQNDGPAEEHLRSVALGERTGVMTPSVEPTMEPVEDFYPTNTMEGYWGSGDYLETMSYMGPEGDDYGGLVTKVPTDMYDFEDPYSEVYDTSFPTRAVLVPSSTLQTGYPSQATRVHSEVHVTRSPFLTRPVQPSFPMTSIPSLTTQGLYDIHVSSSGSPRPTSVLPAFPGASVLHSMPLPSGATHTASIYNWSTSALPTFPPGFAEPYTNASSNVNMTGSPPRIRPSVVVSPLVPPTRSPTRPQDSGPEWSDEVTIAPTDLLLPDMNSLEFFTIQQQGKDPSRPSHTAFSPSLETDIPPTHILPTAVFTVDPNHLLTASFGEDLLPAHNTSWPDESSADTSGYEPPSFPTLRPDQTASPNGTSLEPSLMLTPSMEPSMPTSVWGSGGGSGWMTTPSIVTTPEVPHETSLHTSILPPPTTKLSPWDISPTVLESVPNGTSSFPPGISPSATVGPTPDSPSTGFNGTSVPFAPTQPAGNGTAIPSFPTQPAGNGTAIPSFPTQPAGNGTAIPSFPTQPAGNGTAIPSFPTQPAGNDSTISSAPTHPVGNGTTIPQPVGPFTPNATSIPSLTDMADEAATSPGPTTVKPPPTTTVRQYLCNITKPENYLIKAGFPSGSTAGYAKAKVREILKPEFNQSLELQVVKAPPDFVFRVVSGTVVYTAISVVNALRQSPRAPRSFLYVSRVSTAPNPQYHVHTVLQFVPSHMDVRVCSFSERIEKGLTAAYAEVRRRSRESTNFTVQIVNITVSGPPKLTRLQQQAPVDVVFAVRDAQGYLRGADLSAHLRALSTVEFSYYLGLPVLQIAEPVHYPELNMTLLLRSSWVKTVLLGVVEPRVSDRTFQAKMERRLAQLLGEAMGLRRVRRATSVANNSIQMVRTTRLPGADSPLEMVYFVEGANGERLSAVTTATTLNRLDVQRAAIVLGYRVQGILAQPFEKVAGFPSEPDSEPISTWVVVGVVVPVLLAVLIASILYWKFCRTDKLEFQPDAMVAGPQRQKSSMSLSRSASPSLHKSPYPGQRPPSSALPRAPSAHSGHSSRSGLRHSTQSLQKSGLPAGSGLHRSVSALKSSTSSVHRSTPSSQRALPAKPSPSIPRPLTQRPGSALQRSESGARRSDSGPHMSTSSSQRSTLSQHRPLPPIPKRLTPIPSKDVPSSTQDDEEEEEEEEEGEEEEEDEEEEEEEEEDERRRRRRREMKPILAASKGKPRKEQAQKTRQKGGRGEEEEEEEEEEGEEEEMEEEEEEERKKTKGVRGGKGRRRRGRKTRRKLQAPSVKGFDFAKLHLGQPSKDDLRVIQEPGATAGTAVTKDTSTSESGDFHAAKNASSRTARKKGRISPSDGDSVTSDRSSEKGSPLGRLRGTTAPHDPKQSRKMVANGLSGPPPVPGSGGPDDQLSSSASIFEHVDRMSRAAEGVPKRFSNKIQLIAMQPMPALPAHSQGMVERTPGPDSKLNKDIQVALRHKSEIEHHRNKIRLRAKRKGHYDFPAMDELAADCTGTGGGDAKEQDRIYQKAQQQIDKILDPDTHLPSPFTEPKKSGRGRRSPKSRKMNGGVYEHDRDQLITAETDGTYRKYPGVSNFAYVSDPEQAEPGRGPSPPSPDDVFLSPGSPPPSHVPPPPPYLPPQPSIEEARQQMHSLLDDAFALVSPTAQGSAPSLATAGITLPGVGVGMGMGMGNGHAHPPSSSPPSRGPPRPPWGMPPSSAASTSLASSSPYAPPGPFSGRYGDIGLPPPSAQSILQRPGLGSGFLPPTSEGVSGEQPAVDSFTSRGGYGDELSSSARPRPVGGTPAGHLHHLGMPSRLGVLPPSGGRLGAPQAAGYGWSTYEDEFSKPGNLREPAHRGAGLREPTAPPVHLDTPGLGYPSSTSALQGEGHGLPPPTHSSASLIKAIREELMRLSQKQASLPSFHS